MGLQLVIAHLTTCRIFCVSDLLSSFLVPAEFI